MMLVRSPENCSQETSLLGTKTIDFFFLTIFVFVSQLLKTLTLPPYPRPLFIE